MARSTMADRLHSEANMAHLELRTAAQAEQFVNDTVHEYMKHCVGVDWGSPEGDAQVTALVERSLQDVAKAGKIVGYRNVNVETLRDEDVDKANLVRDVFDRLGLYGRPGIATLSPVVQLLLEVYEAEDLAPWIVEDDELIAADLGEPPHIHKPDAAKVMVTGELQLPFPLTYITIDISLGEEDIDDEDVEGLLTAIDRVERVLDLQEEIEKDVQGYMQGGNRMMSGPERAALAKAIEAETAKLNKQPIIPLETKPSDETYLRAMLGAQKGTAHHHGSPVALIINRKDLDITKELEAFTTGMAASLGVPEDMLRGDDKYATLSMGCKVPAPPPCPLCAKERYVVESCDHTFTIGDTTYTLPELLAGAGPHEVTVEERDGRYTVMFKPGSGPRSFMAMGYEKDPGLDGWDVKKDGKPFYNSVLGVPFQPNPDEEHDTAVWVWYHLTCEKYDNEVCDHPKGVPITSQERRLVSKHAELCRRVGSHLMHCRDPEVQTNLRRAAYTWEERFSKDGIEAIYAAFPMYKEVEEKAMALRAQMISPNDRTRSW
jgi:hypothetical protein